MRGLIAGLLCLVGITSTHAEEFDLDHLFGNPSPAIEVASSCIFKRQYTVGQIKACVYRCGGSKKTIEVNRDELCPIYHEK